MMRQLLALSFSALATIPRAYPLAYRQSATEMVPIGCRFCACSALTRAIAAFAPKESSRVAKMSDAIMYFRFHGLIPL